MLAGKEAKTYFEFFLNLLSLVEKMKTFNNITQKKNMQRQIHILDFRYRRERVRQSFMQPYDVTQKIAIFR